MLNTLARGFDNGQMTSLDVYSNLNILLDRMRGSGMCGPPQESSKIVIERAEAKPLAGNTVAQKAVVISKMIGEVISGMDARNPDDWAYIVLLRDIQSSQAMFDLKTVRPPPAAVKSDAMHHVNKIERCIRNLANASVTIGVVRDTIVSHLKSLKENIAEGLKIETRVKKIFVTRGESFLSSVMVLFYLCHDRGYSLSIKRPYNTTRWHVAASRDNEIIEAASSSHLPDAVMGLRELLVEKDEDTVLIDKGTLAIIDKKTPKTLSQVAADVFERVAVALKTKTPAQVIADLEASAGCYSRVGKKKKLEEASVKSMYDVDLKSLERAIALYRLRAEKATDARRMETDLKLHHVFEQAVIDVQCIYGALKHVEREEDCENASQTKNTGQVIDEAAAMMVLFEKRKVVEEAWLSYERKVISAMSNMGKKIKEIAG